MNVLKQTFRLGSKSCTRTISSKSRLKDLLASMPKETTHVPILREGRKAKKENLVKYPAGLINLQVLGNGCKGAPRSLYVFTDQTRYMFNCGEGTQRLAHEHKMKLAKLEHVFVTNNSWDATGGLPGVALTIQDIGVPEITLHGPPRIEKLFEGTRRFVILKDLRIKVANPSSKGYEDHILEIHYVRLAGSEDHSEKSSSSEESVLEEDETDYYAPIKSCKRSLHISTEQPEKKSKTEVNDGEDTTSSDTVMCYVCRPKKKEGTLLIEKCVEMGVPAGPMLGKLKSGYDVTLADGRIVKAQDVRSPDLPGPVFIVVDCPDDRYVNSLTENEILKRYQTTSVHEDIPHVIVHFTPLHVMSQEKYKNWMNKYSQSKHLILNDACTGMGSEAVHRIQHKLNILDNYMFPLLNENGVESYYPAEEDPLVNRLDIFNAPECLKDLQVPVVMGATLLRFALRPNVENESSSSLIINPDENVREVHETDDFETMLEQLKSKSEALVGDKEIYPECIFFGTGSCIPNKTRNTSAILVNTDPSTSLLMDCGEGTYGQLVRFFGNEEVDNILVKLKCIYISHLHADHHIGLIQVIRKRYEALRNKNILPTPVYLMAPHQILTWLHLYNKSFEKIKHAYTLVPNVDLRYNREVKEENVTVSEVRHKLGLRSIETAYVRHCPNAFGVAFTHESGWKLTYSGDTMPCNSLVDIGMNSDILIHEATMEDDLKQEAVIKMHSTTSEAIEIGRSMNAKFVLLTHFSQRYAKVPVINENFGSNVGIAFDNMRVRKCDLPKIPLMYDALKCMFNEDVEEMEQKSNRRNKRKEHEAMNLKNVAR